MSLLIINVYMPCDKKYVDDEYLNVLNEISQTMYKYHSSHIMIGGDFNVDFSRTSHNTNILSDFILLKSVDLACASVPNTYISHTNATSIVDHFLLSQSLYNDITSCLIKDNNLFSDHVPVQLSLGIDVEHVSVVERPFVARLA